MERRERPADDIAPSAAALTDERGGLPICA